MRTGDLLAVAVALVIFTLDPARASTAQGDTTRVSVDSEGNQGNDNSFSPAVSADGRHVAFTSFATNLVAGDTNNNTDVFIHQFLADSVPAGPGDFFVDDDGSTFERDIDRLRAAGVTRGCNPPTNDRFCPNDPVTRRQMAAFLVRALGLS